jgi:hypothetical protein
MKSILFLAFLGLSLNAHAEQWNCKGGHNLETISFDYQIGGVSNFNVVAPDLDQKGLQESFVQVNEFTIVANQLLDNRAQETIDYTLIIDRGAHTLTVLSQWSTNENVDSETISCKVSK